MSILQSHNASAQEALYNASKDEALRKLGLDPDAAFAHPEAVARALRRQTRIKAALAQLPAEAAPCSAGQPRPRAQRQEGLGGEACSTAIPFGDGAVRRPRFELPPRGEVYASLVAILAGCFVLYFGVLHPTSLQGYFNQAGAAKASLTERYSPSRQLNRFLMGGMNQVYGSDGAIARSEPAALPSKP